MGLNLLDDILSDKGVKIGIIVLIAVTIVAVSVTGVMQDNTAVEEKAEQWYELVTNEDVEVLTVKDHGSLQQVVVRQPNGQTADVFITSDGRFIVQRPQHVENATEQLRQVKDFYSCMQENNVLFHGQFRNINDTRARQLRQLTARQMQIMPGSAQYIRTVSVQCSAREIQAGRCPYFSKGNETLPSYTISRKDGLRMTSASRLAEFSGCSLFQSG